MKVIVVILIFYKGQLKVFIVISKVLALVENLPREGRIGQQPSGMVCHFFIFDNFDNYKCQGSNAV